MIYDNFPISISHHAALLRPKRESQFYCWWCIDAFYSYSNQIIAPFKRSACLALAPSEGISVKGAYQVLWCNTRPRSETHDVISTRLLFMCNPQHENHIEEMIADAQLRFFRITIDQHRLTVSHIKRLRYV